MAYEDDISRLQLPSLGDIYTISRKYIPNEYLFNPWHHPEINHGVSLLMSNEALCCYMVAYGEMHEIKCKSVMRSLPFDDIQTNIEVVDWGCGQGIGTLSLIEMLNERDKLHLLRKVTLIEPSTAALQRAEININCFTHGRVIIDAINNFLPSSTNDTLTLSYSYNTVIHIFSNILDIIDVDLVKIAKLIHTSENKKHYILCIGPTNGNAYRIEQFVAIFSPQRFLSKIESKTFGITTSTQHTFSCFARCFEYNDESLTIDAMNGVIIPEAVDGKPILDDYDPRLAVQNGIVSEQAYQFIQAISSLIGQNDSVFFSPNINDDKPDIVIVRPNVSIFIIHFFDGRYLKQDYRPQAIEILKNYKENLITLHLNRVSEQRIFNTSYWSIIKTIGIFSNSTTSEIRSMFNSKYEILFGLDDIQLNIFEKDSGWKAYNRNFDSIIRQDFLQILSPGWHSYKEGVSIRLSREQRDIINSNSRQQKIKGTAGSGKTEVLVQRAVKSQLKSNKTVLILTYNLSLKNYIRYRLSKVREDFAWDKFQINNYHQLIKSTANNLGLDKQLDPWNNEKIYEPLHEKISKYAAIFIDEVQDYETSWLHILMNYFLEPNGEFVVFGDPKQNIHNRPLDENGDIRLGIIGGQWKGSLLRGYRYVNQSINNLISRYQQAFFDIPDNIEQQAELNFSTEFIKLVTPTTENIANTCIRIITANKLDKSQTVILFETHDLIREVDYLLRSHGYYTLTTSETKEQYEQIQKNDRQTYSQKEDDINALRRAKKLHFTMQTNILKLSTIDSYKGWESENVILIIEQERHSGDDFISPERIYTGITRAKNNLFILSLGNDRYDNFFNNI